MISASTPFSIPPHHGVCQAKSTARYSASRSRGYAVGAEWLASWTSDQRAGRRQSARPGFAEPRKSALQTFPPRKSLIIQPSSFVGFFSCNLPISIVRLADQDRGGGPQDLRKIPGISVCARPLRGRGVEGVDFPVAVAPSCRLASPAGWSAAGPTPSTMRSMSHRVSGLATSSRAGVWCAAGRAHWAPLWRIARRSDLRPLAVAVRCPERR